MTTYIQLTANHRDFNLLAPRRGEKHPGTITNANNTYVSRAGDIYVSTDGDVYQGQGIVQIQAFLLHANRRSFSLRAPRVEKSNG